MKKSLLTLLTSFFVLYSFGQITFEKTSPGQLSSAKKSDDKIVFFTENLFNTKTIKIYNEDLSLFKNIDLSTTVDSKWDRISTFFIDHHKYDLNNLLLSDNLFNNDSKLEFIVYVTNQEMTEFAYLIVNEDGTVLQTINITDLPSFSNGVGSLYKRSDGISFLALQTGVDQMDHFRLNGNLVSAISNPFDSDVSNVASVYPNPSKDYIKLDYVMPKGLSTITLRIFDTKGTMLKEMTADGLTGFVLVNIEELKNGNYILKTMDQDTLLSTNQFIVMK